MKNNIRYILTIISFFVIVVFSQCHYNSISGEIIFIENGKIKLGFEKGTGKFISFSDQVNSYEFISRNLVKGLPWEVNFQPSSTDVMSIREINPLKFSFSKPNPLTILLEWEKFEGLKNLRVQASVSLDEEKALSYWNINIEGIEGKLIENLVFPKIEGLKDIGNEKLAIPIWMGELINNPRAVLSGMRGKRMGWSYPGPLSLQCIALYNPHKNGIYASCNDTLAYVKNFSFTLDTLNNLTYQLDNYPALDSTLNSYKTPYDAIVGSFKGDWITAAENYREWAINQHWCRDSRLQNNLVPAWLENTALWVWNRGKSDNVLTPAINLEQRLGLPVNVFWHWWHGCSYDDGFPEYFPPREGKESFINAVHSAQNKGVKSIVYMNSFQWGDDTESWGNEHASTYAVKDIYGNMRSHVYNIFTGKSLTNMCMGTQFWRDKYASLCDSAVNTYESNGVYMDQACLNRMCYDSGHDHSSGGGNYWVNNFGKLTEQIRLKVSAKNEPALAGEGCGEAWLPYLDGMLTLQVSRERYAGVGEWEVIPFFQAVYHQYGITYGNYSSLVTPPYDELWPNEFAPPKQEQPLDEDYNKQFLMEQARSFVWGLQPTIANYHDFLASERKDEINYLMDITQLRYKGLKYLLYGKFLRSPVTQIPVEEIKISRLSIYAGREGQSVTSFQKSYPVIYSGAWKASDSSVGIVLASISSKVELITLAFKADDYCLAPEGKIYIINKEGKTSLGNYSKGNVNLEYTLQPKELAIIEIVPAK